MIDPTEQPGRLAMLREAPATCGLWLRLLRRDPRLCLRTIQAFGTLRRRYTGRGVWMIGSLVGIIIVDQGHPADDWPHFIIQAAKLSSSPRPLTTPEIVRLLQRFGRLRLALPLKEGAAHA